MKKILLGALLLLSTLGFSQSKIKKIEIYKSPSFEYVDAKILFENNIERDTIIVFYGRDHQYQIIDEYLTFFNGTPYDFNTFILKLRNSFDEDINTTIIIDDVNVSVKKMMGKKIISVSIEGKSGYRLFNQKNIDKIIDKFNIWATNNQIYFNK